MNANEDAVVVIAADGGLLFELIACYYWCLLCCYVK